ncbi:MAG: PAS domain-containing sensor histidine kinase [Acidobacteriota bacterium]|nr:PAS domain-containing sensor histidine kinase [Acidobacteriota bacterium]
MDSLINRAPCGYVAFADDGTIVEINETLATSMLGYTRVELLGWHFEKLLPAGGRIFYHTHLFPLLKMQETVEEVYFALRTKDGRDVPVLINAARRERGGIFISDCFCMRMLQRHQYEEQLLQARRQAEEANASKAKFLSMMSHDLRTPLTTIYGNAELIRLSGELDDQQTQSVEAIREACRTLTRMIGDILEFAQLDSGRVTVKPADVNVSEAFARTHSLLRAQLQEANLSYTTSDCDGAMVTADPDKLQQILLNLVTNAIKFTPPGGRISVDCERAGDRVRILVRDTGIGIAEADLQRIFSPFVQLDAAGSVARNPLGAPRGVGLGLAISRDLAQAMHGDISAQSTPGHGSTFIVDLPAAPVAVPAHES